MTNLLLAAPALQRADQRAAADACLPRLPGHVAAHAAGFEAGSSRGAGGGAAAGEGQDGGGSHRFQVDYSSALRQAYSQTGAAGAVPADQQQHIQQQQQQQQAGPADTPQRHHGAHSSRGQQGLPQQQSSGSPGVSELPGITRTADILVVAVGYPNLVRREWVKPGAVVIDVGINVVPRHGTEQEAQQGAAAQQQGAAAQQQQQRAAAGGEAALQRSQQQARQRPPVVNDYCTPDGASRLGGWSEQDSAAQQPWHVVGDVDFCDVAPVAAALTPVPGGVGPMTIAAVLHNTVQAARYNLGLEKQELR